MRQSFHQCVDEYLDAWRMSSLTKLKSFISKDYEAREITSDGQVLDFGYAESINGWEQGFNFVLANGAKWVLQEISVMTLRSNEVMVILAAGIILEDKMLDTVNLFFQTFKRNDTNSWVLVRSYIESGIPAVNVSQLQFGK